MPIQASALLCYHGNICGYIYTTTGYDRCSTWQGLASLSGIPKAALPIAVVFKYTLDTPIDASSEDKKVTAYLSQPGRLMLTLLDIFGRHVRAPYV